MKALNNDSLQTQQLMDSLLNPHLNSHILYAYRDSTLWELDGTWAPAHAVETYKEPRKTAFDSITPGVSKFTQWEPKGSWKTPKVAWIEESPKLDFPHDTRIQGFFFSSLLITGCVFVILLFKNLTPKSKW